MSYERQGLGVFTGLYGGNPGSTLSLTRSANTGDLVRPGELWPVLYSERDRLDPAVFPETPTYPIAVRAGQWRLMRATVSSFAWDESMGSPHQRTIWPLL